MILGLIDEESDLYSAVVGSGRVAISVLRDGDGQLADRFAGLLPAPGGLFADGQWQRTEYGPVRSGLPSWAGCRLASTEPVGYARLVQASVETVHLADAPVPPLVRHHGRYVRLAP
jgi:flavin reductase (DIM6/NTAB) family NADH-FMN oxidoreductase RutF